ncbi:hypothetical protein OESDEN_19870 [Oesophagostomum dentatum]|uniref:Uncharacterized protein n=1 Tax=Oesophagostomum dentatum TaxID=61180 RepID=A0A0B1S693_OESDE|nr:hypothetical protein OESDEN_19870 [Oesophagostomum dentatum]
MVNKPFPIKERLLSTVEFSIKHGKIYNLDVYGENLNLLQYYSIDVIAFLSLIALLMLIIFVQLCRLLLKLLLLRKLKQE